MRLSAIKSKVSEHTHQVNLVRWFRLQYPKIKIMATPNGGKRHIVVAVKLKQEGVSAGYPDIFIPFPVLPYAGLYIELKAAKGVLSDHQKEWMQYLNDVGYLAICCYGFDEAKEEIEKYLWIEKNSK